MVRCGASTESDKNESFEIGRRDEKMSTQYGGTGPQVDVGTHWLLRIVAAIIDSIPWAIVSSILWYVLVFNAGAPLNKAIGGFWWLVWIFLVPILYGLLWVIYSTAMESSNSAATFGKRIMGLKVQMLNGSKAPSNKVLMRNLSKIFWILFIIDFLIGIATPGPDPRQRYFDRIAGTTVVSVKQAFAQASPPPPPPP
jgi:uncharacterized RDD family membrane protein YckC